jgi:hypothetical protein
VLLIGTFPKNLLLRKESTNQQQELPVLAMFVNGSQMSNLYRGPSIDATYHVSVLLANETKECEVANFYGQVANFHGP